MVRRLPAGHQIVVAAFARQIRQAVVEPDDVPVLDRVALITRYGGRNMIRLLARRHFPIVAGGANAGGRLKRSPYMAAFAGDYSVRINERESGLKMIKGNSSI